MCTGVKTEIGMQSSKLMTLTFMILSSLLIQDNSFSHAFTLQKVVIPSFEVTFPSALLVHRESFPLCFLHNHRAPFEGSKGSLFAAGNEVDESVQTGSQMDDAMGEFENVSGSGNEYSFYDEATIYVRAGSGGQGATTFYNAGNAAKAGKAQRGKPNGGDGGKGGDIYLEIDPSLNTLAYLNYVGYRPNAFGGGGKAAVASNPSRNGDSSSAGNNDWLKSFRANKGGDGQWGFKNAKNSEDVFIKVPSGTVVEEEVTYVDPTSGESRTTYKLLGEVRAPPTQSSRGIPNTVSDLEAANAKSVLLVAKGGDGGEGNGGTGSGGKGAGGRGVKRARLPPQGGERKRLRLTLKVVADVALVGVPNAGKSTFLAAVTRAKPKIANYPFTTVIPNLGVWIPSVLPSLQPSSRAKQEAAMNSNVQEGSPSLVLCDVPGLIEGAADGIGLGHAFLRHVERCHVILHIVDCTAEDPLSDFRIINDELVRYGNGVLVNKPQVVVVNKSDAWSRDDQSFENHGTTSTNAPLVRYPKYEKEELQNRLREIMPHSRLMFMSAHNKEGVEDLMSRLAMFVGKVKDSNSATVK